MLKPLFFSILLMPLASIGQNIGYYYSDKITDAKNADRVVRFSPNPDGSYKVVTTSIDDNSRISVAEYSEYDASLKSAREGKYTLYHHTGFVAEEGMYKDNKRIGTWKFYAYENGNLVGEVSYVNGLEEGRFVGCNFKDHSVNEEGHFVRGRKEGEWKRFRTGNVYVSTIYKKGKEIGPMVVYKDNIQRLNVTYKKGKFRKGRAFDEHGIEVEFVPGKYDSLGASECRVTGDSVAYCPYDYTKFLVENLTYPPLAEHNNIEGRVKVSFWVDEQGNICDVKVVQSVSSPLDAEAVRAIRTFPQWRPSRIDGRLVKSPFTIPVMFRLPYGQAQQRL